MKIRTALECLGVLALVIGWYYVKQVERSRDKMLQKVGFLADHLDAQVTISENLIQELKRTKDGKVKTVTRFLPPEGKVTIETPKEGKPKIVIDRSGFAFRPGVSVSYLNGVRVGVSTKLFFFDRYGLIGNLERSGAYVGVSRYVDDLVPFWRPKNLELFIAYRLCAFRDESGRIRLGVRVTL